MASDLDRVVDPDRTALTPPLEPEPSLGELFRQLAQDSSTLIRQEVALAKTELTRSLSRAAVGAAGIVAGALVAVVGVLVLIAALVVGLGDLIDNYWLSALIVGVLFVAIGGLLAKSNLDRVKGVDYKPDLTIQTLKEDKRWAQAEAQQVKRDLTS